MESNILAAFPLGLPELIILAVIAFFFFGPKRLPEIGEAFGKTIRSFKDATAEGDKKALPEETNK